MEERKDFFVYVHQLEDGTVFYVGEGTNYRDTDKYSRSQQWLDITSKNSYKVIRVKENLTKKESLKEEARLIAYYGRLNNNTGSLTNMNDGGKVFKRKDNYFYGKNLKGNLNGNYGNKYESNPNSIPIYMLNLQGEVIQTFASAQEAEDKYGYTASCIIDCCNGKRGLHSGYQFVKHYDYLEAPNHIYKPRKTHKQPLVQCIIENNVLKYVALYDSASSTEAYGFNPKNVSAASTGAKKTHKGFMWLKFLNLTKEQQEYILQKFKKNNNETNKI